MSVIRSWKYFKISWKSPGNHLELSFQSLLASLYYKWILLIFFHIPLDHTVFIRQMRWHAWFSAYTHTMIKHEFIFSWENYKLFFHLFYIIKNNNRYSEISEWCLSVLIVRNCGVCWPHLSLISIFNFISTFLLH